MTQTINRRTATGWTQPEENKSTTHCDICGEKLWMGPSGKPYCNGNWKECKSPIKTAPKPDYNKCNKGHTLTPILNKAGTMYIWDCQTCIDEQNKILSCEECNAHYKIPGPGPLRATETHCPECTERAAQ